MYTSIYTSRSATALTQHFPPSIALYAEYALRRRTPAGLQICTVLRVAATATDWADHNIVAQAGKGG
eukprot:3202867-Pleurochrysis_carterae.AAC.1